MAKWKIYNEDAVEWAKNYQKAKFHALLCDAPYHLTSIVKRFGKKNSAPAQFGTDGVFSRASKGFMGSTWDGGDLAFRPETWEAFGEVLHPGAFGMAFSASRNWHRMAVAIEDAGFILHPTIFLWAYGQGFPKATNISKQLEKGKVVGHQKITGQALGKTKGFKGTNPNEQEYKTEWELVEFESEMGQAWEGHRYGLQALKPAVEPIIVFQKPYEGKPIQNIVSTGAGALNIDGSRIGTSKNVPASPRRAPQNQTYGDLSNDPATGSGWDANVGRWASNFILDESVAGRLDEQSGDRPTGEVHRRVGMGYHGSDVVQENIITNGGDSGGASRFFYNVRDKLDESDPVYYCGKVSPKERQAGLEEKNNHPTLKPIDLMKYLATLLLPPVEYAPRRIFVPFSGVASEMIGAGLAGWEHVVGVEFDKENGYVDIAEKRLDYWLGDKQ